MIRKTDLDGEVFIVLVDNEFAGWFNIPSGNKSTEILRAALSSNPSIINLSDLSIDIPDLPDQAGGWKWDGQSFKKDEE
jgi:hypothetical protein